MEEDIDSVDKSVFLWICTYPHGSLVTKSGPKKRPNVLQKSGEWHRHLSEVEPDFDPVPILSGHRAMAVVGLVRVRLAVQWSVLRPHNWAMHDQWQYQGKPLDAFFVAVEKYWSLGEPTLAESRVRSTGRSRGVDAQFLRQSVRIRLPEHSLFQNAQPPLDADVSVGDGYHVSARSVLRAAGYDAANDASSVPTMCLVEPLAQLLSHGRLPFLIVLARWEHALQLWPAWPDRQWALAMKGRHF